MSPVYVRLIPGEPTLVRAGAAAKAAKAIERRVKERRK